MDKPADQYHPNNIRVLHVDDEPMICDVTRISLERGGRFKVDAVHSAEEALALLRESSYACVISDYEMPSMNGIELLKEIRSFDQEIPFILFSGRGRETVVIDAINTGADFFIQKGGDSKSLFAELNHKVHYAINKRNARLSLKRRDSILEAVSLVATLFLGGEPFQKALAESVALFGLATDVDRVMAYRLCEESDGQSVFRCLSSWCRPDVISNDEEVTILPVFSFSIIQKILDGEVIIGASDIFDDATGIILEKRHIKSVAAIPVTAEQKVRGMIMFCDCLSEREWAMVEVDALQAAASIIGSAIFQDEMRTELINGKEQYESMYSMMRQLCDAVPDMLWAKDLTGNFIFVNNEAATGLLGAPDTSEPIGKQESEYHGRDALSSVVPDATDISCFPTIAKNNEPVTRTIEQTISGHGKKIELEIRSVPYYNASGELIGSVSVGRDVTEARSSERMIQKERKRYSQIFHSVHIGMISCTHEGVVIEINNRAVDLLGLDNDKGVGFNLHTLPDIDKNNFIPDFTTAISKKKPVHGKGSFTDMKGKSRILYYAITPHPNDNSGITDLILSVDEHYQD